MESERNRPLELQNEPVDETLNPERDKVIQYMLQAVKTGISPQKAANIVIKCIQAEQFYILTDLEFTPEVQKRIEDILEQRNPT